MSSRAAGPYVVDTVRVLREPLAVAETAAPLPRAVGGRQTYVCGVPAMRVVTPCTLFMVQRVQDVYEALGADARVIVTSLAAGAGWDERLAERASRSNAAASSSPPGARAAQRASVFGRSAFA